MLELRHALLGAVVVAPLIAAVFGLILFVAQVMWATR